MLDGCRRARRGLAHDRAAGALRDERFVESELASENLVFYFRAHEYVAQWDNRTDAENLAEAKFIWDQYLHENAPEQVGRGYAQMLVELTVHTSVRFLVFVFP